MAGSVSMLNPIHAASRGAAAGRQSRFCQPALVEATVTMLGRTFRTTIHEGATTNELIEKVARENGGEVAKKYYPEFQTWEITSVRIGDVALVKSSESGIHFSLGASGIPMAVTEGGGTVFPNGDELPIGPAIRDIALWPTPANFDPGNVADLDRMYVNQGGVKASREALDEISRAHGGGRSGKMALEINNILVLNKDTGEILTVSEHALKEPAPAAIMPERILLSLPQYASCSPAPVEPRSFVPAQFDAFRSPIDMGRLIVRTFDGQIADFVRIQMNPFSQDKLDAGILAMPKEQKMIPMPTHNAGQSAHPAQPALCVPAFASESRADGPDFPPSSPPPASPGVQAKPAKTIRCTGAETAIPAMPPSQSCQKPMRGRKAAPITYEAVSKAWSEPRSEPMTLGFPPDAAIPKNPKTWQNRNRQRQFQKAWPAKLVRRALGAAGFISIIMRMMKERARRVEADHKAKNGEKAGNTAAKKARALPHASLKRKSMPPRAWPAHAGAATARNGRKENRIMGQERPISRPKTRIHRNFRPAPEQKTARAPSQARTARKAARLMRAQTGSEAGKRKNLLHALSARPRLLCAKRRGKKHRSSLYLSDLLGIFARKKKITGRAWAGN